MPDGGKRIHPQSVSNFKILEPWLEPQLFHDRLFNGGDWAIEESFLPRPFTSVISTEFKLCSDGPEQERITLHRKNKTSFSQQMKKVSYADGESQFQAQVNVLKNLKLYEEVKDYVENTWLSCSWRLAHAFRQQLAVNIVNTNNGTDAMNKLFKYEYLPRSVDKSVYGIAITIVESLFLIRINSICKVT